MRRLLSSLLAVVACMFAAAAQTSDSLYVEGSKGRLFTIVDTPAMAPGERLPVVIVCHGFGGNCIGGLMQLLADDIVKQGMIAVRFDFNGGGRSDGEFKDMTVPNEVADLLCEVAWVKAQSWCKDVSLVGHSQGGVVVSMAAGELGYPDIRSEVLMAPAAVLRDDAIRGNTMGAMYDYWNIPGDYVQLPGWGGPGLKLGKAYIDAAVTLPIYETAQRFTGPALILHGTHDKVVPFTYGERYASVLKQSTLHLLPGDDHGFSLTAPQSAREVADWLKIN